MAQSFIFINYLLLFFYSIFVNAKGTNNANDPERQSLNENDLHIIVYTYYVFGTLNAIGCFFIFYKTFRKWILCKRNKNKLTMSYRLPFYTAIADSGILFSGAINIIHTAVYARVWEQPMCTIIGVLTWFFMSLNISLYGVISIMTYIRVCREICFDSGRYDYKLWLIISTIIIALQILASPFYGPGKYWCIARSKTIALSVTNFTLCFILFLVTITCYILIYRTIGATLSEVDDDYENDNRNERDLSHATIFDAKCQMERKASIKIASYILVFFIQVYNIGSWCNVDKPWIYVFVVIGINLGGIGNAIQYMVNEGHFTQHKTSSKNIKTKPDDESYSTPGSIELNDLSINIIVKNDKNIVENEIVDDPLSSK